MATPLTLPRACESMIRYKPATRKSEPRIADYRNSFKKHQLYLDGNPAF